MDEELRAKVTARLPLSNSDENNENHNMAIYYDAWKNDNDTEPILSLIYEMAKQLSVEFSLSDIKITKTLCAIIQAISGYDVNIIKNALTSSDIFTKFREQKKVGDKIQEFLSGLLAERGNRLFVFIDELDRCKPSFAVHLLEQVKHYIFDDRITFIFSVNLEQLQHTIKHYYGDDFDSCRYLDRFFDLRISIPPANMDKFYSELGLESSYYVDIVTKKVIKMFDFGLREITRFYSQVKSAVYEPTHNNVEYDFSFPDGRGKYFVLAFIVPLLIGLKIADITKYDNFINGRDIEPLRELLSMDEDDGILVNMLNINESFDEEEGKTLVTPDVIIRKVYEAIFVHQYDGKNYSITIGKYKFTKTSKTLAISSASMLTTFAELS